MSSKFSYMDTINEYFHKMQERIQVLELENSNLKKFKNAEVDQLKKELSSLSERHKELKEVFLESENQIKNLIREKEEILQKEKEFSELLKSKFEEKSNDQIFSTPKRSTDIKNESQKMIFLKAKKPHLKLELNNIYDSESESENSKIKINLSNLVSKEETKSDDEGIDVMKKLIGADLWNSMESNTNASQQNNQHKSSQTRLNQDEELVLLTNMFGSYLAKLNLQEKTGTYLDSLVEANNFLCSQVSGKK